MANVMRQCTRGMWASLLFLTGCFFVCLLLTTIISSVVVNWWGSTNNAVLMSVVAQNALAFVLPSLIVVAFALGAPMKALHFDVPPQWGGVAFVLLITVALLPAMNYVICWNENIHLPQSLLPLEQVLRTAEDAAKAVSDRLLYDIGFSQMLVLVLCIGIITGIGEETFFRGALTQIFVTGQLNRHAVIWLVAFVFSFMHFQFFGFVPRMLLGALFGYLLMWSGSLWLPIIAHSINNSIVVVSSYCLSNGVMSQSIDKLGTDECMPWLSLVSVALVSVLVICRKKFFALH